MEELIKKIDLIIQNFSTGEVGKSLFSIIALREMIFNEIRQYGKDEKGKDDKKIQK